MAVCERHNQELLAQVADSQTQSSGARERVDSLQETMNCKQELTAFATAELEGQLSAAKVASATARGKRGSKESIGGTAGCSEGHLTAV